MSRSENRLLAVGLAFVFIALSLLCLKSCYPAYAKAPSDDLGPPLQYPVVLVWNANAQSDQVAFYNVYEMTLSIKGGNPWRYVKTTVAPTVTLYVPRGGHTWAVTAVNAWGESAKSGPVSVDL